MTHADDQFVYSHADLEEHSMYGNSYVGLATGSMGANEFEVWRGSIAVGSRSPRHVHETEEVFIVLKGKIRAVIGDQEHVIEAPGTLICPANIPHQLINVGDVATDHILVLGVGSKIFDLQGAELNLPWRR